MSVAAAPTEVEGNHLWLTEGYESASTPRGWVVTQRSGAATRDPVRIEITLTGTPAPGTSERVDGRHLERSVQNLGAAGSGGDEVQLTYWEPLGASGVVCRQVRQQDGLGAPDFELDALIRGNGLYVASAK